VRLQIHHDGAKLAPTPERKVINANLADVANGLGGQGNDASENRHPAGLDTQAIRDPHAKSATSGQPNNLHDLEEPCRHPRPGGSERSETLDEDFAPTGDHFAKAFAHQNQQTYALSSARQIGDLARVATMHTCGRGATERATR